MARREVQGYWYDPSTQKFYADSKTKEPISSFTFEDFAYINPDADKIKDVNDTLVYGQPSRPLSPWDAPTEETAKAIFDWAKKTVSWHASLRLSEEPVAQHRSHPEWYIYAQKATFNPDEDPETSGFSAGRLASSLIRNGSTWAERSFIAELKNEKAWVE